MDPIQNAMQSLQQPQALNPQAGFLALRQKQAQYNNAAPQQDPQPNQNAAVSQALNKLGDTSTAGKVGGAISNDPGWANLCEAYAEKQIYGRTGIYPTAIAAYDDHAKKGNINTSTNVPKGAQAFFNADNGNGYNGHTMVSLGGGKFQGPLQNGKIGTFTLEDWLKYSGQQYLGYAPANSK